MTEKEFKKWVSLQNKELDKRGIQWYINDREVAVLDMKRHKLAYSKCHKEDTFSAFIGKAIAYARLKGEEIPTVEKEPERWRADENEEYWFVTSTGIVNCYYEQTDITDDKLYNNCNYFKTKERAEKVAKKIKFLFKLEQYHDLYCPDYVPDWDNNKQHKYNVYFDCFGNKYRVAETYGYKHTTGVYFQTEKIAQKVCDKLNNELKNDLS